jgi:DNA-binding NarL/FixJ family response regulator
MKKVLLFDSSEVYLEGVAALLHSKGYQVTAYPLEKEQALEALNYSFSLLIFGFTDDRQEEELKVAEKLKNYCSNMIAILTADCYPFLEEIVKLSPQSYLHRFAPKKILFQAVEETIKGKSFIDRKIAPWLYRLVFVAENTCSLSSQERKIAHLVSLGFTNQKIAEELCITVNTVKFHLKNIYAKAGVKNRRDFQKFFRPSPFYD